MAADERGDVGPWVARTATVAGDVSLGEGASVWHGAVVRGDEAPVTIGRNSNVQDCAVIHVSRGLPASIGEGVTVGHGAIVHGSAVGDDTLVGMGAIVLDGCEIGRGCIIGAGALLTQCTKVPDGSVALGSPARVVRGVTDDELASSRENARRYVELARQGLREGSAGDA